MPINVAALEGILEHTRRWSLLSHTDVAGSDYRLHAIHINLK